MKQTVYRSSELEILKNELGKLDPSDIFLVRGKGSYNASGAENFISEIVDSHKITEFYNFENNPQLSDLKEGISLFRQGNFKQIVAIGGGSVLDMAKLIRVFAHQKNDYTDLIQAKALLVEHKTPLLAIPTTAGTGAEATQFAVIYIDKTKYSVDHKILLPESVYLSASFTHSAKPYLSACTGLDAFCQAIESAWSINANSESEQYAVKAAKLVWDNLYKAVEHNNNDAKENMCEAAYLAGKAINITRTTAPHAISYAFTSYYGIPHGHAVALSIPFFLKFNYNVTSDDCMDKKGILAIKNRIDNLLNQLGITIAEAPDRIRSFFNSLGINTNINDLIKDFNADVIIRNVNTQRLKTNPRKVTDDVLANCLEENKIAK